MGLVHDSRHVCFHVMMQIRHVICDGTSELDKFQQVSIMLDNCFHNHALELVRLG